MENLNEKVRISGGLADSPEKMLAEGLGADALCVDHNAGNNTVVINKDINERIREHARTVMGIDLPAPDSKFWESIPDLTIEEIHARHGLPRT